MKTYKNLYENFISDENIKLAIKKASKGKRNREIAAKVNNDIDAYVIYFRELCKDYKNEKHKPKEIYDGITRKKRTIYVPTFNEKVVHHMVVNILKPIFMKSMYEYSCGSIPKRGGHKLKKKIEKWIQKDPKHTKYCFKMDVKKYFDSIPLDILKAKLSRIIKDENFLKVLFEIIDVKEVGLPLGFYTSQWLANFYLTKLDHYIKEQLKADYLARYVDDMVILGGNKRKLHIIKKQIEIYLIEKLGLIMKDNWQVFKIRFIDKNGKSRGRDLDFLGFKFSRFNTTLRRSIMLRASKKARKIASVVKPTIFLCRQMLSYVGWLSATNTYGFYLKWIYPYVDIQSLKRRISNYERSRKLCGMRLNTV